MEANRILKNIGIFISSILLPLYLAYMGNSYTKAIKEREIQAKFVELAVDTLRQKPMNENRNLREWAVQVIDKYSGVKLSKAVKDDLIEKIPIPEKKYFPPGFPKGAFPEGSFPKGPIPKRTP